MKKKKYSSINQQKETNRKNNSNNKMNHLYALASLSLRLSSDMDKTRPLFTTGPVATPVNSFCNSLAFQVFNTKHIKKAIQAIIAMTATIHPSSKSPSPAS